jgi:ADP-heptose:LPS heptosyltransferase
MWSPERFADLTRRLQQAWGGSFVLVGSSEELRAEQMFSTAGGLSALSLIGKSSLTETFALLEQCQLLIANDTGLAKAAAALKTPTVTLWGPSNPAEFQSPWDSSNHLNVRTGIACSPCSWMGMPSRALNYSNCVHHDCLNRLEPEVVAGAILRRWPRLLKR